jgi:hypothetical protein
VKKQFRKRLVLPVAIALVAIIAVSGVAYAYWTANGSGNGSAAAAPGTNDVTVNQTSTITGLFPGAVARTLSGNFDNLNAGPVYVASVTAVVSSVTGNPGTCPLTDFAVAGSAPVGATIPAGTSQGAWTGLTIQLVETGINQDGCKGATVHLTYTAVP